MKEYDEYLWSVADRGEGQAYDYEDEWFDEELAREREEQWMKEMAEWMGDVEDEKA